MNRITQAASLVAVCAVVSASLLAWAQDKKDAPPPHEREIKEAEVPAAALAALKKLAGGAAFTEFAEEVDYGQTVYEGSWKGPDGNVDAVVTKTGDVVEIEEIMPVEKVPAGVRTAAEKEAGKDTKITYERKTLFLYEIHYKKDGKGHEAMFRTMGVPYQESGKQEQDKDDDKDK
jgi:hypothetical protein